jgi:hypothetical protein
MALPPAQRRRGWRLAKLGNKPETRKEKGAQKPGSGQPPLGRLPCWQDAATKERFYRRNHSPSLLQRQEVCRAGTGFAASSHHWKMPVRLRIQPGRCRVGGVRQGHTLPTFTPSCPRPVCTRVLHCVEEDSCIHAGYGHAGRRRGGGRGCGCGGRGQAWGGTSVQAPAPLLRPASGCVTSQSGACTSVLVLLCAHMCCNRWEGARRCRRLLGSVSTRVWLCTPPILALHLNPPCPPRAPVAARYAGVRISAAAAIRSGARRTRGARPRSGGPTGTTTIDASSPYAAALGLTPGVPPQRPRPAGTAARGGWG